MAAVEKLIFEELFSNSELVELVKFVQVVPEAIMHEIKRVASDKGISVELEIASRLLITFIDPEVFVATPMSCEILNHKFSEKEAFEECRKQRENWLYLYEIEKLRLLLDFKGKVPRAFKEKFMLIDVDVETKRILDERRDGDDGVV